MSMAQATTATTDASHSLFIHRRALAAWHRIPDDVRADLRAILDEAAALRSPSEHEKAQLMRGCGNIFRLRKGDYRVLCNKEGPKLRVLAVDNREYIYDKTDIAKERAEDQ